MASFNFMASLTMVLVLLPLIAKGTDIPPFLAPCHENICNEVECGKGTCEAAPGKPFGWVCNCNDNWKRTRFENGEKVQFLPCVIPNCSLDYSCMPAAPPAPAIPNNWSFFDPCNWIYCGEGTCSKNLTYTYTCQCDSGSYNLLNITAFPCYRDCAIGSDDCGRLGIKVSNSSSSTPSGGGGSGGAIGSGDCGRLGIRVSNSSSSTPFGGGGSGATSFQRGKFNWLVTMIKWFVTMIKRLVKMMALKI